jgi:hypothetical protein
MSSIVINTTKSGLTEHAELQEYLDNYNWPYEVFNDLTLEPKGVTGIACEHKKIFAICVTKYIGAEWKLQEMFYKNVGCSVVKDTALNFGKCECHANLPKGFEELIQEIKEQA